MPRGGHNVGPIGAFQKRLGRKTLLKMVFFFRVADSVVALGVVEQPGERRLSFFRVAESMACAAGSSSRGSGGSPPRLKQDPCFRRGAGARPPL